MANNLENRDSYIIIGIDEENDYQVFDISNDPNRKTSQKLVDFLRAKHFAGGVRPYVLVRSLKLGDKTIDVLVIPNSSKTPYFLLEKYQGVYANSIYTRIGDSNTPKNSSADINYQEILWRKRFGFDLSPLEKAKRYLEEPDNWISSPTDAEMLDYYNYAPEFVIENIALDNRNGYEFYLFSQTDYTPHWYEINIRYHQTLLESYSGVALDGGRYFTVCPDRGFILYNGETYNPDTDITYRYFIHNSLRYAIYNYYLSKVQDNSEAYYANRNYLKCILIFQSKLEKDHFDRYVITKEYLSEIKIDDFLLPRFPELKGYRMEAFKKDYINALKLQITLKEFRETR